MSISPYRHKSISPETFGGRQLDQFFEEGRQFDQFMDCSRKYFALAQKLAEELTPDEVDAITMELGEARDWINYYLKSQSGRCHSGVPDILENGLLEMFPVLFQKYSSLKKELLAELPQDRTETKVAQLLRIRVWLVANAARYQEHQAYLPEGYETELCSLDDMRFQRIVCSSEEYCKLVEEIAEEFSPAESFQKERKLEEIRKYLDSEAVWLREYLAEHPEFLPQIPGGHPF